jgi:hypothetical protein
MRRCQLMVIIEVHVLSILRKNSLDVKSHIPIPKKKKKNA